MIAELPDLQGLDLTDPDGVLARLATLDPDAPTHPIALTVLGQVLLDTGSEPYVEEGLRALLAASDVVPVAAYSAAVLLLEQGETERSVELLAAAADSALPPAQALLGELLLEAGDQQGGLELLVDAALGGEPPAALRVAELLAAGEVVRGMGREQAIPLFEAAAAAGLHAAEDALLRHLVDEELFDAFIARLTRAAARRHLAPRDMRELGARVSACDLGLLFEAALALAPQERDVRAAFVDGILLSESELEPSDEADLRLAFSLEHPLS